MVTRHITTKISKMIDGIITINRENLSKLSKHLFKSREYKLAEDIIIMAIDYLDHEHIKKELLRALIVLRVKGTYEGKNNMYTCIQFLKHKYELLETPTHWLLKSRSTNEVVHKFTKELIRINITDNYIEVY